MDKLPVYEMIIDENPESEVEVSFVALVDKPAIEKNFMAFKSLKLDFAADPARQIISGPAMVADTLIYRKDAGGEYNVFFSKETIAEIALKFFKKDYQKNLNLFHDPTLSLQGVTIFESFISDKSRGVRPMVGFEDLPDGTWFISAKVENPDVWAKIQSGEVKGFSVEGIFSYTKKPKIVEEQIAEILNRTYNEDSHILKTDIMSTVKDMVAKFKKTFFDGTPLVAPVAAPPVVPVASPQVLNTDYKLKDGVTAVTIDKLEAGGVMLIGGLPAPAGEHELEDGTKVTVGDGGVISAVTPGMALPVAASITMTEVDLAIQRALTAYKEEMSKERLTAAQKLTEAEKTITDQNTKITGLFDIVEKLADTPTADPVVDNHLTFNQQRHQAKEERISVLTKNLKALRKTA